MLAPPVLAARGKGGRAGKGVGVGVGAVVDVCYGDKEGEHATAREDRAEKRKKGAAGQRNASKYSVRGALLDGCLLA